VPRSDDPPPPGWGLCPPTRDGKEKWAFCVAGLGRDAVRTDRLGALGDVDAGLPLGPLRIPKPTTAGRLFRVSIGRIWVAVDFKKNNGLTLGRTRAKSQSLRSSEQKPGAAGRTPRKARSVFLNLPASCVKVRPKALVALTGRRNGAGQREKKTFKGDRGTREAPQNTAQGAWDEIKLGFF